MIKQFFTTQSKTITSAAMILGITSLGSRFIGIIRDRIFAHLFGAGQVLDAYYAAFRIPDLVYNLIIVGALSAGFIPIFTELIKKDKEEAWQVTNSILNLFGLFLLVICTLLFILTPWLMPIFVPGFSPEAVRITVTLTRIMFLSPIILGVSSIVSGVLQSYRSFLIYSLTPIFYNIGIIIGALIFVPLFGIPGLALGVILGALLHLAIQLPTFFHYGFRYQPLLEWKNTAVRAIGKLMIPRTLGLAAIQVTLLVITSFASMLGPGSITVFNLANNLQLFPISIIGISFAVAAFPTLSALATEEKEAFTKHIANTIKQITFFMVPATVLFLLLRAQIVRVVLGSGAFDWQDTILTADTLAFFTLSLLPQALLPLLVRAFFALRDTWTPLVLALVGSAITIVGTIYAKTLLGVPGIALAYGLGIMIQVALLWLTLRHRLGTLHEMLWLNSLYKISASALIMAVVVQYVKIPLAAIVDMTRFWGIFTQGFVAGILGLIIYGFLCYLLRVEEMMRFTEAITRRFVTTKNVPTEVTAMEK